MEMQDETNKSQVSKGERADSQRIGTDRRAGEIAGGGQPEQQHGPAAERSTVRLGRHSRLVVFARELYAAPA
jgi:hypothetical protein